MCTQIVNTEDDDAKSVSVTFINSSSFTLGTRSYALNDGVWSDPPTPPSPSFLLEPGKSVTYINSATSAFGDLGGNINLSLPNGDTITGFWSWLQGQALVDGASSNSAEVQVSQSTLNPQSNNPTLQILIEPNN